MGRTRITLYGGVDEIGGNKILLDHDGHRVFLDFGMSFGKQGAFYAEFLKPRSVASLGDMLRLGVLPRLDGVYRQDLCRIPGVAQLTAEYDAPELWDAGIESYEEMRARTGRTPVEGVVLSHAHMDHFGHFGYLDPRIPVYGTPVTIAALDAVAKISGTGVEGEITQGKTRGLGRVKSGRFEGRPTLRDGEPWERPLLARAPYQPFQVGPFEITLIPVDHSIPGAASVLVRVGGRSIYYSGDVRFHGLFHDITARLRSTVRDLRPDVFLCEGTRMSEKEPDDEESVRSELTKTFGDAPGLALVDFGWKDTTRFVTLQRVAAATGRTFVISWKLAYLLRRLHATDPAAFPSVESYGNVRVYVRRHDSMLYSDFDYNKDPLKLGYWDGNWSEAPDDDGLVYAHRDKGVRAPDIRRSPGKHLLMLSQYEMGDLVDLAPPAGSRFVRAACEPFSDEMDLDLQRQARWIQTFGMPVQQDRAPREDGGRRPPPVPVSLHASGHACGPHIEEFVRLVGARTVIPIHTTRADAFEGFADVTKAAYGAVVEL